MVGALQWLRHLNPLRYAFAAIVVNEFQPMNGRCSNFIPQGPGYENVSLANTVCNSVGAVAGEAFVSGSRFVKLSFGYYHGELWRVRYPNSFFHGRA